MGTWKFENLPPVFGSDDGSPAKSGTRVEHSFGGGTRAASLPLGELPNSPGSSGLAALGPRDAQRRAKNRAGRCREATPERAHGVPIGVSAS